MTTFNLFQLLPPFIDIIIEGTNERFENCSPRFTLSGSQVRFSYGNNEIDCPLYFAQNDVDLINKVKEYAKILHSNNEFTTAFVMIGGFEYPEP